MEDSSTQQQQQVEMDPAGLKFFSSKVKIWDFACLSFTDYQKFSLEDRSSILNSCYSEMSQRYSTGSSIFCICCFKCLRISLIDFWLKVRDFPPLVLEQPSVLETAASDVLKNGNLITLPKRSVENDRNLTNKVVSKRWMGGRSWAR